MAASEYEVFGVGGEGRRELLQLTCTGCGCGIRADRRSGLNEYWDGLRKVGIRRVDGERVKDYCAACAVGHGFMRAVLGQR